MAVPPASLAQAQSGKRICEDKVTKWPEQEATTKQSTGPSAEASADRLLLSARTNFVELQGQAKPQASV
jgi:hypothetical protein